VATTLHNKRLIPLYNLLKKNAAFEWTQECQDSFDLLKTRFTTAPILAHFDAHQDHILETDASDYAVGAVLLQKGDDDVLRPVGFISRTMNSAERNYPIFDKEMLAIFWAFTEWRPMLLSCQKTITTVTDHKAILYFMSTKVLNRRQARWAEYLAEFDFVVRYRPGEENGQADALSRREDVCPTASEGGSSYAANNPDNIKPLLQPQHLRGAMIYEPDELLSDLRKAQELDPAVQAIVQKIQTDKSTSYTIKEGLLFLDERIYVPSEDSLKLRILRSRHDHPTAGHPGRNKTLLIVRRDFYWPGIKDYVERYVQGCHQCRRAKASRHKPYGLLQPLPVPQRPWSSISMDFIDQLPESQGFDAILVVIDRLTKMGVLVASTTRVTAEELAVLFVQHVFSKHGTPSDIVSDRGNKFTSAFWTTLSKALGIKQSMSTAYHPQTDGQTERVNQVVETYLRMYINYDQNDWSTYLPLAEFCYNNSPHSATGESPFFLNKGYHPTLDIKISGLTKKAHGVEIEKIQALHEHAKAELRKAAELMKCYADRRR